MEPSLSAHCVTRRLVRATFSDTDLMGIVHHASYLSFFEAGRVEYMRRRGIDYGLSAVRGVHLAVVEVGLRYLRPTHFDQLVLVETRLSELTRVKVKFCYRLLAHGAEELCVEGHTLLACVGEGNRPRRLPDEMRQRLLSEETLPRPIDQV